MKSTSDGDWQAEILAVEERANAAFVNRDLEQLEHLFSDELLRDGDLVVVMGSTQSGTRLPSRFCSAGSRTSGAGRAIAGGSTSGTPT